MGEQTHVTIVSYLRSCYPRGQAQPDQWYHNPNSLVAAPGLIPEPRNLPVVRHGREAARSGRIRIRSAATRQCALDLVEPSEADQTDGEVAQHGPGLRGGAGVGVLVVLAVHDVADPVALVLDRSVRDGVDDGVYGVVRGAASDRAGADGRVGRWCAGGGRARSTIPVRG